ncbi:MAG: hypothetical protein M1812_006048 [Candelaria pacifica]|nr:MAG: hypothetical protein M1812_006048 [Candelaria pacifica]
MALKRKRSCSTFSSPLSNTSSVERDPSQSPTPVSPFPSVHREQASLSPTGYLGTGAQNWGNYGTEHTPHHLNIRTRKRFRDNRPNETIIYQHTLQKLYSASRNPLPQPSNPPSFPNPPQKPTPPQSSLHAFWSLPHRIPTFTSPAPLLSTSSSLVDSQPTCEDCDCLIDSPNGFDTMDIDNIPGQEDISCRECSRQVCDRCAVIAEGRTCLECATSERRSIGGIGCWT